MLIGCSIILFSCKKEGSAKSIKLAHSLSVSHPVHIHKAMVFMIKNAIRVWR